MIGVVLGVASGVDETIYDAQVIAVPFIKKYWHVVVDYPTSPSIAIGY